MYNINGFLFEDEKIAELAKKEEEAVSYIKGNTALDDIEGVYQLYTRILEQKLFVTPVGIRFLTELQSILYNSAVPKETIPPIPAVFYQASEAAQEPQVEADVKSDAVQTEATQGVQVEAGGKSEETDAAQAETAQNEKESKKKSAKTQTQKTESKEVAKYKKAYHVALFFAIVFGLSVAGMFLISELSGNNVNIINYRNEIIDEYSTWEAELKEKEEMLKEWEEELNERDATNTTK